MTMGSQPTRQQSNRRRLVYSERRFSVLLAVLLAILTMPPMLLGVGLSAGWFEGLVSILVLAGIVSLCFEPQQRLFALLLGVPSVLFSMGGYAFTGDTSRWVLFVGHLCQVLFFLGAAVMIVRSMFGSVTLTFDNIAGALCGYLFLGMGWAVTYSMIESFRPGSFAVSQSLVSGDEPATTPRQALTYFSFVTLTTTGYGDILPNSHTTRTCAWIEAIMGQFYLAVLVAGLVGVLVTKAGSVRRNEDTPDKADQPEGTIGDQQSRAGSPRRLDSK